MSWTSTWQPYFGTSPVGVHVLFSWLQIRRSTDLLASSVGLAVLCVLDRYVAFRAKALEAPTGHALPRENALVAVAWRTAQRLSSGLLLLVIVSFDLVLFVETIVFLGLGELLVMKAAKHEQHFFLAVAPHDVDPTDVEEQASADTRPEAQSALLSPAEWELVKGWLHWQPSRVELLWRASTDGWAAADFHSRCNYSGPTLTIVSDEDGNVFGGFADAAWTNSYGDGVGYPMCLTCVQSSPHAFLCVVRSAEGLLPVKMPVKDKDDGKAVWHSKMTGPTFGAITWYYSQVGGGVHQCGEHPADLCLLNGWAKDRHPRACYINVGHHYTLPPQHERYLPLLSRGNDGVDPTWRVKNDTWHVSWNPRHFEAAEIEVFGVR